MNAALRDAPIPPHACAAGPDVGHCATCGERLPTWWRAFPGHYQRLARDERVLGEVRRVGGRWLASTDNMNGSGLFDSHDGHKTLGAAQAWVERYGQPAGAVVKTIILYGSFSLPGPEGETLNFVFVSYPEKGVPWRKLTAAMNRLVKTFYPEKTRAKDRYFNIDGDTYSTSKGRRYAWDGTDFVASDVQKGQS